MSECGCLKGVESWHTEQRTGAEKAAVVQAEADETATQAAARRAVPDTAKAEAGVRAQVVRGSHAGTTMPTQWEERLEVGKDGQVLFRQGRESESQQTRTGGPCQTSKMKRT